MRVTETLAVRGPFSLRAAAEFGFGPTEGAAPRWDGAMRFTFALDGGRGHAGVVLRRPSPDGPLEVDLSLEGTDDVAAALAQVARTVSLDHDGEAWARLGARDPVMGALQRAHPGQRPVLFCSPYEAAAWGVLSARRPAAQGARIRAALGAELGATFSLDGESWSAFPQPERLAGLRDDFPGLNATKVARLRGVAAAALAGELDVARIHGLGPEAAYADVQRLAGIGPFYAGLIVLRASGFADAWLQTLPAVHFGEDPFELYYGGYDAARLASIADGWRPFRTWALVLLRLAAGRGTRLDR